MSKLNKALSFFFLLLFLFSIGLVASFVPDTDNLIITDEAKLKNRHTVSVKVDGEVKNKGNYKIMQGKTYHDAIYMAGGITENADISSIVLDTPVMSDCIIFVPKAKEKGVSALKHMEFSSSAEHLKCNINTAGREDLKNLYGIGDVLAERITIYREENGKFKSIYELLNIKGMGKSIFNKIKDYITVGGD